MPFKLLLYFRLMWHKGIMFEYFKLKFINGDDSSSVSIINSTSSPGYDTRSKFYWFLQLQLHISPNIVICCLEKKELFFMKYASSYRKRTDAQNVWHILYISLHLFTYKILYKFSSKHRTHKNENWLKMIHHKIYYIWSFLWIDAI